MYLFVIYGTFILILLVIFFTFTYSHYQKNAIKETTKDMENMCASVENSLITQLDHLSTISMNIVYSNAIKANFKEFSQYYQQSGQNPSLLAASHEKALAIHDIVTAMIGAYQTASEINIYTMDGSCVTSGYWQRLITVDLENMSWYEEVMARNGHKYFTLPQFRNYLPAQGKNQDYQQFISLVRLFLDIDGQPEGIVEIVQDCDTIFSLASQLEDQNPGTNVYIYNERKELVYPYFTVPSENYLLSLEHSLSKQAPDVFLETEHGDSFFFSYRHVPDYEWTILLLKPKADVYASLRNFRLLFSFIGIGSIFLTLMVCFYISQRLTRPLEKLTVATSKITINRVLDETKVNLTSADSNIMELSLLCQSIRTMYEELCSTSQEILLSKSEETKAKLRATQSLINPHFLYNCLTSISIMAEDEDNDTIVQMCHALCDYFRYISSSRDMMVPLEEEIFYTTRYLKCMQLRFSEELEYTLDISEETKQYLIPKLILQPLVENAFKYAFLKKPPWKLHISSSRTEDSWILKIEDNGGNLSEAKKTELLNSFHNLDMNQQLNSMEIGGMGLKNVYLRLQLLYGNKAIFKIDTTAPQKTIFILGGPIYHSREEYYEQHPKI